MATKELRRINWAENHKCCHRNLYLIEGTSICDIGTELLLSKSYCAEIDSFIIQIFGFLYSADLQLFRMKLAFSYIHVPTSQAGQEDTLPEVKKVKVNAITQAVSCWLPTVEARVRARVWSSVICGGHFGAGVGYLGVLRIFPLPIFIPPTAHHMSSVAGTIGQTVAAVPSGLSLTPPE
jgi:hypothetical protein